MSILSEIRDKGKKRKAGERFATLNAFTDATMRTLTPAQIAVWVILFRNERNGTTSRSVRQIATDGGLSLSGAHQSLASLIEAGLVEILQRARHRDEATTYRIHATPNRTTQANGLPRSDRSTQANGTVRFIDRNRTTQANNSRKQKAERASASAPEGAEVAA